jgi:hypothetical protein
LSESLYDLDEDPCIARVLGDRFWSATVAHQPAVVVPIRQPKSSSRR